MINKIADAIRLYKFGIFRIYLNKLLPAHLQYQNLLIYRHDLMNTEIREAGNGIEFKRVERVEDPDFEKFRKKFPAKVFKDRLEDPDQLCYVVFQNADVAGYGWIAKKALFLDSVNRHFPLNKDELFIYACYVPKEFRGLGIYPAMLNKMILDSKEMGYRRAYIGVSSANKGSIRGIEKAGFTLQKKVNYLKLGGFEWCRGLENSPKLMDKVVVNF